VNKLSLNYYQKTYTYVLLAAMSIVCMEIAPKLGEDVTRVSILPLLLQFLRDDVVDVRLNVLKRMDAIAPWMATYEATLLPAITDLSKDLQWRVREAVILALPALVVSMVYFLTLHVHHIVFC